MNARARLAASPALRGAATALLRGTQRLRRSGSATRPVLINSIPKAGTHLAAALVETANIARYSGRTLIAPAITESAGALTNGLSVVRPGFYAPAHIPYADETAQAVAASGVASLFIVRDPRAIAASHASFVMQRKHHSLHELYAGMPSSADRLRASILGTSHRDFRLPPLAERLESFAGWLSDAGTLVVRFEDLAGASGGGSDATQSATVDLIAAHCGVPEGSLAGADLPSAFGRRSTTFSRGKTEGWRRAFDDELLELIETEVGDVGRRFGYT